jgi:hypothetical protein
MAFFNVGICKNKLWLHAVVISDKLIVARLVNKCPEGSLQCSLKPVTGTVPSQAIQIDIVTAQILSIYTQVPQDLFFSG